MIYDRDINRFTHHHIKFVLGINVPLNESFSVSEARLIIHEHLLYETFLDTIKKAVSSKVDKFKEWKDALVAMVKILSNPTTLQNFSDNYWKTFKKNGKVAIDKILEKFGLTKLAEKFQSLVDKITSLQGWKKFMAATAVGSIVTYVIENIKKFPGDQLKDYITNYLTDNALPDILSKLSDINSYLGWLSPIIKGAEVFYNSIKGTLSKPGFAGKFNEDLDLTLNELKVSLDQLMKGVDTEMEHTKKPSEALKIAVDHFKEDPEYYDKLKKAGLEEDLNEMPMSDLVKVDQYADKQLDPIDVVLTDRHFFDRLSDPRNTKPISAAELIGFFKRISKDKNKFIEFLDQYGEIVAKDDRTKINIPFMKQANKAIAKTIMRKDDFKTPSPEYKFEDVEELNEGEFCPKCMIEYILEHRNVLHEAEYKGRKVQLGKPMAGDVKKFKVYVKNKQGKVVKVNFGQKGVKIKKNNPERRKSFRARHKCHTAKDRTTPRYWSCRKW